MTDQERRIALLNKILQAENNFLSSIKDLAQYPWDFDGVPAVLDKSILKQILSRYIAGQMSQTLVYEWAEFLELREDVEYPENEHHAIESILHEFANPDLEGELTLARAQFLLKTL